MKLKYKTADAVEFINLRALFDEGKRFILIDLDNTVARWRSFDIKDGVKGWVNSALEAGFSICLLSNNHNRRRTVEIARTLGIKAFRSTKKKPNKRAYTEAVDFLGGDIRKTVMIGDQLISDIKGAEKAGIDGILINPIYIKEAPITKFMRLLEVLHGRKMIWQEK